MAHHPYARHRKLKGQRHGTPMSALRPAGKNTVKFESHETPSLNWKAGAASPAAAVTVVVTRKRRWPELEFSEAGSHRE
jgi:hypothetical protein